MYTTSVVFLHFHDAKFVLILKSFVAYLHISVVVRPYYKFVSQQLSLGLKIEFCGVGLGLR